MELFLGSGSNASRGGEKQWHQGWGEIESATIDLFLANHELCYPDEQDGKSATGPSKKVSFPERIHG